ncbi:DNA-binding transcriptional MerR regulator [Sphingomonas jejuensis]|uniref:DNA-binding transcriptional MerR regulator n=1 Tax=Sphingomonas jejuensis TaxID=904715 RepID=A0ABX0XNR0_9SPHN|nr:MerR family transcriptional regulator [Sphingomonas jejuensis]NJC34875.1 DNA-binding transcriptional MerR regulator [Sphingomonas jejuensis]
MTDDRQGEKGEDAFLTIGELADRLGVAHHVLRYWETRFPQLRPLQRSGRRRYYRPADVALATRINTLLNREGYTVKGVQQLLSGTATPAPSAESPAEDAGANDALLTDLKRIRDRLAAALQADG